MHHWYGQATLVPKRSYPIPLGEYEQLVYVSLQLRALYTMVRDCDHENVMRALKNNKPIPWKFKTHLCGGPSCQM